MIGSQIGQQLRDGLSQGKKKWERKKNEGRVQEKKTNLRVAGMRRNIRKTYTQAPPSNPALMKN